MDLYVIIIVIYGMNYNVNLSDINNTTKRIEIDLTNIINNIINNIIKNTVKNTTKRTETKL